MKLVVVPGFLGFADEPHHIDLIQRAQIIGVEGLVVESDELAKLTCIVSPYTFAVHDDMESRLGDWESRGLYTFSSSRYGEIDIPYEFVADAQKFDARLRLGALNYS